MKSKIWTVLAMLGFAGALLGQTNGGPSPVSSTETTAVTTDPSPAAYLVLGATAQQEALVRAQIQVMQPSVLPLRIIFVPTWKFLYAERMFRVHLPKGYNCAMFTHLASRTVFIDSDRYIDDDSLGFWVAHELGHLATNNADENDANKAARDYRQRLKDARLASRIIASN